MLLLANKACFRLNQYTGLIIAASFCSFYLCFLRSELAELEVYASHFAGGDIWRAKDRGYS